MLRRQCHSQPVVIVLEDLQWVRSDSLALLEWLIRTVHEWPLLLLGTYRDDERPDLPDDLPRAQVLRLERLTEVGIAELSESIRQRGRKARQSPPPAPPEPEPEDDVDDSQAAEPADDIPR